jgi:hypothetical protein
MRATRPLDTAMRLTAAGVAALALAGCGGGAASLEPGGGSSASSTLANILAFGRPNPPPAPAAADPNAIRLICPDIEVPDGLAALRAGGQAGGSVRYQYSLGETARECSLANNQIAIRVGVEGRVLIGPAGSTGSFSVPVRVAIQRNSDQKAETSKVYKVAVNVPAGETQGSFTLVTDPIYVPYKHEDATDDYSIVVGFDGARQPAAPVQRRRRR